MADLRLIEQLVRDNINPYTELGLTRSADARAIKKAWRSKAKDLHPDLHPELGAEAFQRASLAYEILSDATLRAAYDLGHRRHTPGRRSRPPKTRRPRRPRRQLSERELVTVYIKALADCVRRVVHGERWRVWATTEAATDKQRRFIRSMWSRPKGLSFVPGAHQDSLKRVYRCLDSLDKSEASAFIEVLQGLQQLGAWPMAGAQIRTIASALRAQKRAGGVS